MFEPGAILEAILQLQQQRHSQHAVGGGGLGRLPTSIVRTICQQLSHADIEQCRLVCTEWRTAFGEASVTDMYLAMCADFARASELTRSFHKAYPNFHHLHFWIPGGPVRQMMGTDGSTFSQYMELFSSCPVRVLTAHYLDDTVCPVQGITRLKGLTKLELVDLMPASASLACLSSLSNLRHLILEYKDSSASPDLASIGQLPSLTHLELALHSTFVTNPVYMTLPSRGGETAAAPLGVSDRSRPSSDWLAHVLSASTAAAGQEQGAEGQARLEAVLEAILDAVPSLQTAPLPTPMPMMSGEVVAVLDELLLSAQAAVAGTPGVGPGAGPGAESPHVHDMQMLAAVALYGAAAGAVETLGGGVTSTTPDWIALAVEELLAGVGVEDGATGATIVEAAAETGLAAGLAVGAAAAADGEEGEGETGEARVGQQLATQGAGDPALVGAAGPGNDSVGPSAQGESVPAASVPVSEAEAPPATAATPATSAAATSAATPSAAAQAATANSQGRDSSPRQGACGRQGDGALSISDGGAGPSFVSRALPCGRHSAECSGESATCSGACRSAKTVPATIALANSQGTGAGGSGGVQGTSGALHGSNGQVGVARLLMSHPVSDWGEDLSSASLDYSVASDDSASEGEAETQREAEVGTCGEVHGHAAGDAGVWKQAPVGADWQFLVDFDPEDLKRHAIGSEDLKGYSFSYSLQPFVSRGELASPTRGERSCAWRQAAGVNALDAAAKGGSAVGAASSSTSGTQAGDGASGDGACSDSSVHTLDSAEKGPGPSDGAEATAAAAGRWGDGEQRGGEELAEEARGGAQEASASAGSSTASAVAPGQDAEAGVAGGDGGDGASLSPDAAAAGPSNPSAATVELPSTANPGPAAPAECVVPAPAGPSPSGASGGNAAADGTVSSAQAPPMRTLAVSSADYLLANMVAHWSKLRTLQRLELRCCPHALARCYPLLFTIVPSLTELKFVGPDARLKAYGPSQPAFKVEVARDTTTLALAPSTLALALHCDTASDTGAALQQLALLAASVAPAASPAAAAAPAGVSTTITSSTQTGSAGGTGSLTSGSLPGSSSGVASSSTGAGAGAGAGAAAAASSSGAAAAAGPSANRSAAAWTPWSAAPSFGEMLAAATAAPAAYPVGAPPPLSQHAAALAAAEEKRRQQVMEQHPCMGILQAHSARLATLRLYLENPEFSTLKPLAQLPHLQELYIALCYTSGSDSDSEDGTLSTGDDASVDEDDTTAAMGTGSSAAAAAGAAPTTTAAAAAAAAAAATAPAPAAAAAEGAHLPSTAEPVQASGGAAGSAAVAGGTVDLQGAGGAGGTVTATELVAGTRQPQQPGAPAELSSKHILTVLRGLPRLTSLTVREEIPAGEEGSPCSHETCALTPTSCSALAHSLKHLVHLEWQGMLTAPHPSSLQALASLACLRSLTLVVNQDDPMARVGVHCLPPSLSSLTLQNISVTPAPRSQPHRLPTLCHLHLKSCAVPDIGTFSVASSLEWLSLDNCDVAMYVPDLVDLWPSLSWLEITYTHQDWRLLHSPADLPTLGSLTRLRKLSLVTPYEDLLTTDALLALTQLRLLSISPSPSMGYEQFVRLAELRFLAGLEVKLYSDVLHHEELVEMAGAMHADLQESLPMTDVLIMCDDAYADDPS